MNDPHWRKEAKAPADARLLSLPIIALYLYLIVDALPPTSDADRAAIALLGAILIVLLVGSIAVRLRASGMVYVFLTAAVLQAFATFTMLITRWRSVEAIVFISVFLILSHLFVASRFRRAARAAREVEST
ncbi:MAG TPA: hypothetical protein VM737_05250 [Gemmatimonadota bacterium]|nr:hypothetical protein [Gemmatimonadota bacterium]